jgi:1-acyl-sn-glycerol-3-phosphate acyltransferase
MLTKALYRVSRVLLKLYATLMLKMDIRWQATLPKGPLLFAANHPSTTDPIFIHLISPQPMSVMIAAKVFSIPVLGPYMRKLQQICVTPGNGDQVLEQAHQTLKAGRSVTIFPEGLISPGTGQFHAPRSGVARLALKSGVPVVPIGIYLAENGCKRVAAQVDGEPDLITWYLRGPYAITIGKPLHFSGNADDTALVRSISETVMQSIRALALESQQRASS